jgi:ubiquinone biosynthesis monooxygenase Coq6
MDAAIRRRGAYVCRSCTRSLQRQLRRTYSSAAQPDIYDVVCVGGGPAGLSLLTALREYHRRYTPVYAGILTTGH